MNTITLNSYAKINLTLDVLGTLPNGFHQVEMIMQQISLCDTVTTSWTPEKNLTVPQGENFKIELAPGRPDLPSDSGNLAYRAAEMMYDRFKDHIPPASDNPGDKGKTDSFTGSLKIKIEKRIPIAAGLAGGSSNCAAVIHAVNKLWNLRLPLEELCRLGAILGSDVPFCIMGQAAANPVLSEDFKDDSLACHCALAMGRGTDLKPLKGLDTYLVLSKPPVSVSTAEVYRGIDSEVISVRPNTEEMIRAIAENNHKVVEKNMINVLENFSLKRYPNIVYTKNKMSDLYDLGCSLMSGSGPTVFCLCRNAEEAKSLYENMLEINEESFLAKTTN